MADKTIVIPSYWGPPKKEGMNGDKIFDHPTPLDEEGTLKRMLDSLDLLNDKDFQLVIIPSVTVNGINDKVIEKVESIIAPFKKKYDISLLHYHNIAKMRNELIAIGIPKKACSLLNLDNYSSIRNMCSIAGILNDSEITIFIDDDEVFIDPEFIEKACRFVGSTIGTEKIEAVAGYYVVDDARNYRLDSDKVPGWKKRSWNNVTAMNSAFDLIIGTQPRLKLTTFVFGGNMIMHKDLIMRIPFDPVIPRGEDIDFLINVRINGTKFYLDNELYIKHLPPRKKSPEWLSFREDIKRFLYEGITIVLSAIFLFARFTHKKISFSKLQ